MTLHLPLRALRAFEVMSRRLSVKDAAAEIGVTPSAVCHQLRIAEQFLGLPLLKRSGQSMALTRAGRALAPEVTAAFSRMEEAVAALRQPASRKSIRVSADRAVIERILAPAQARAPFGDAVTPLVLKEDSGTTALAAGEVDAAILRAPPTRPGLLCELIHVERYGVLAANSAWATPAPNQVTLCVPRSLEFIAWRWLASPRGAWLKPRCLSIVANEADALAAARNGDALLFGGLTTFGRDLAAGALRLVARAGAQHGGFYLATRDEASRRHMARLASWLDIAFQASAPDDAGEDGIPMEAPAPSDAEALATSEPNAT